MKKIILGFCSLLIIVASCKKVDDSSVFTQSADQRLTAALAKNQAKLSGAQYGWKALVRTNAGGNFTFYFSFNDSNRVKMLSSFDSMSAVTLKESSFRLKALQQPSLLFDTYSYLHVLADPNPAAAGGSAGAGLQSDFEFYFDEANSTDDKIELVGRFNGTQTTLTKATQAERDAFLNGDLAKGLVINKIVNYYKRITIGNTDSVDAFVDARSSYIISPDANGNLLDDSLGTNYTLTLGGLAFAKPLVVGTKTLSELSNINFDATTNSITAVGDGQPITITGVVTPMRVDVNAPSRWWNFAAGQGSYWITETGFHINGVDDAQHIQNLPGYFGFSIFWPEYGTSGGVNYDLFAPIVANSSGNASLAYGAAYRPPVFNADGRVVFRYLGTLGTVPAGAASTYLAMRTQLAIPRGYYLVQISADPVSPAYHMVSAADGKAWITWLF